jgi:hypothetical protein
MDQASNSMRLDPVDFDNELGGLSGATRQPSRSMRLRKRLLAADIAGHQTRVRFRALSTYAVRCLSD